LPVFSNFKLTGGWGQLGNQNINSLQYLALINPSYRYAFGSGGTQNQVSGSAQSRLANTQIGWETAEMSNFGTGSRALEKRIVFFGQLLYQGYKKNAAGTSGSGNDWNFYHS
jgi:hypothetical protein